MLNLDFVALDLGVEGGDFRAEQTRGLALTAAGLDQRTANQFGLEASHFSLQVDPVIALLRIRIFHRCDFA